MKIKKFNIASLAGMTLVAFAMIGCSDDLKEGSAENASIDGIVLSIPNVETSAEFEASRASSAVVNQEGALTDLWLLVFKKSGNNEYTRVMCEDINNVDPINSSISNSYKNYKLNLETGIYKFYLLGNLSHYAGGNSYTSALNSISDIEALNLSFDGVLTPGKLPMACLSSVKLNQSATALDGTEISIDANDIKNGKQIFADLRFLCSKVRYTVLFDNSANGFSSVFGANVIDFDSDVEVDNIIKTTPIKESLSNWDNAYLNVSKTAALNARKYEANYPAKDGSSLDLTGSTADWGNQRAWQGIVYLPENTNSATGKKTTLTITGAVKNPSGQEIYTVERAAELFPAGQAGGVLKRGQMYDLVLSVKDYEGIDARIISITDWTVQALYYTLHGPNELEVETTTIAVTSNEPGKLWYRSDVAPEDITFNYPLIEFTNSQGADQTEEFFIANVMKDNNGQWLLNENGDYQIEVKVNPAIPLNILTQVQNGNGYYKTAYQYFEIVAGRICKKIQVTPLELEAYLKVTPREILIDVREYIASGINDTYINLKIETNITDNITFSSPDLTNITNTSEVLYLTTGEGSSNLNANAFKISNGVGTVRLRVKDFFKSNVFWKTAKSYTLTFNASSGAVNESEQVNIKVKPFTSDYVIHFKPSNGWSNPHIYVYQCLEMPADLPEDSPNKNYEGKTVGYGARDYNNNAGLEYIFTNNIAFKGWLGYGGSVDPNQSATYYNGFVHLGGDNNDNGDLRFNPTNYNYAKNIYNYDVDLNSAHEKSRDSWTCATCKTYVNPTSYNNNGQRTFPGVAMVNEGNGWYKYTLTGVATPGKAMIMFFDGHTWDRATEEAGRRYPNKIDGKDPVGIPLFDFPDNEGWLKYDGIVSNRDQNFYDDQP